MGAEFIAENGVLKGLILLLDKGEEWTIGRDPDLSTIVLEDPKTSRQHARVRKTAAGYTIENFSDTNPVLINGEPVREPTHLEEGVLVKIGETEFRFYSREVAESFAFDEGDYEDDDEELFTEDFGEREPSLEREEKEVEEVSEESDEVVRDEESFEEESEPFFEDEPFFDESEIPELRIDLTETTRFILKVISGPNTGAEFALETEREYLIGTDTATCDVVFNDLSVSREHARLKVSKEGAVTIQDLGSRNGVVIDKERITGIRTLPANSVVALGTSSFLLIDREAPSETIAAPIFETPAEEEEEVERETVVEEKEEGVLAVKRTRERRLLPIGSLVLALIIGGLTVLLGIGLVSLFQTKEIEKIPKDYLSEVETIIKKYPSVRFTYNGVNGKIFLLGHVRNGVEHNELLYQLKGLGFITGVEDNIVNDEAVWQEMNILLSKKSEFKGVSMHSPEPGVFVINGYLKTEDQASKLTDYLNINFNYLDRLKNLVVVEQSVDEEVASRLLQKGFAAVNVSFDNGDLLLTGYVGSQQAFAFERFVEELREIKGVNMVRNFVVQVTPEQGVIDLNTKYLDRPMDKPNLRYRVTGYSKHGDVNINVVINGRIVTRGDCIDGYTITSIQPQAVFMEKEGLKYKIEYNKCKSFGCEE